MYFFLQIYSSYFNRFKEEYGKLHEVASADTQSFLENPINAFLLVKRLSADWKAAESLMLQTVGKGKTLSGIRKIAVQYY